MDTAASVIVRERYCALRGTRKWHSVPLEIYACDEIPDRQEGYRFGTNGESFIGPGGWREGWIVIGHETLMGDPIFIDIQSAELRVFTAEHGQGNWDPVPIARSVRVFFESMTALDKAGQGSLAVESALSTIAALNGDEDIDIDMDFWASLID